MYRIAVFAKMLDFIVSPSASLTISRCAIFKIEPNFAPFAVVVRLIQVDSGGLFFVPFAALDLFQRHGMDKAAFQQLQPQLV
ncbi:MAG: hypothetical protein ACLR6B_00250 [Blautia sp.]